MLEAVTSTVTAVTTVVAGILPGVAPTPTPPTETPASSPAQPAEPAAAPAAEPQNTKAAAPAEPAPSLPDPLGPKPKPHFPAFVEGELLVRFDPATSQNERAGVRGRQSLEKVRDLPLPGLEVARIRDKGGPSDRAVQVRNERSVRYAEPNFIFQPTAVTPNDTDFSQQWGLNNTGQSTGPTGGASAGTADADIDAPEAWEVTSGSENIVVGVLDTGIKIDHPDLAPNIWVNPGESGAKATNGVDDDANGYIDDVNGWDFVNNNKTVFDELDGDDHGTHVAGAIAATFNNTAGVAGVSNAKMIPLKFLGPGGGSTSDAVLALDYAIKKGARLTNNSWGGDGSSQALQDKIEEANTKGQLFLAAAGNGGVDGVGDNNDVTPFYPANYPNTNIISVAATGKTDALASFSNYGATTVDMAAPGVGILSSVPNFTKAVLAGNDTDPALGYKSAYHTFGLEGVPDTAGRDAVMSAGLTRMGVAKTDKILVVDDDAGQGFQTSYQGALTALGYTAVTTETVTTGGLCPAKSGPTAVTMSAYKAVVWFTGHDFDCTLNEADQVALTSYLGTGNLLLFGSDLGYDLTDDGTLLNVFLRDKLRVDYIMDADSNFRPKGVAGTSYASVPTLNLKLGDTAGGQSFSSAVAPRAGAIAGMRGSDYAWYNGTSMATPYVSGAAAQVFAAYPAATNLQVKARLLDNGDAKSGLSGKMVSGKRLNLTGALDTAGAPALTALSASPSPFSPNGDGTADTSTLTWTQNEPAKVTVTVTPQGGTTPVKSAVLGVRHAGDHTWVWDAKTDAGAVVGTGTYDLKVQATDIESASGLASTTAAVEQVLDWSASYSVANTPTAWVGGTTKSYSVTITNNGTKTWPATGTNRVRLGVHFANKAGGYGTNTWYTDQRVEFPADLAPGASVALSLAVKAPNTTGDLVVEYQMVKEGQFWFKQFAAVNANVTTPEWSAAYSVANTPTAWVGGTTKPYSVTITNNGSKTWPATGANRVRLGVHFANKAGGYGTNTWYTDQRVELPADLAPGASVTLSLAVKAPNTTGNMVVEYQMVKEGQFWFKQFAAVNANVTTPEWSAAYSVANTPTAWVGGTTKSYSVTITNNGTKSWPATGTNRARLGVHFANKAGGYGTNTWYTDQRVELPADLAPGASVTLSLAVKAPNTTGNMVVEYQMVKEGQFWFKQFAAVNVTVS